MRYANEVSKDLQDIIQMQLLQEPAYFRETVPSPLFALLVSPWWAMNKRMDWEICLPFQGFPVLLVSASQEANLLCFHATQWDKNEAMQKISKLTRGGPNASTKGSHGEGLRHTAEMDHAVDWRPRDTDSHWWQNTVNKSQALVVHNDKNCQQIRAYFLLTSKIEPSYSIATDPSLKHQNPQVPYKKCCAALAKDLSTSSRLFNTSLSYRTLEMLSGCSTALSKRVISRERKKNMSMYGVF